MPAGTAKYPPYMNAIERRKRRRWKPIYLVNLTGMSFVKLSFLKSGTLIHMPADAHIEQVKIGKAP